MGVALNQEAIMAEAATPPTHMRKSTSSKFSKSKFSQSTSSNPSFAVEDLDEIFGNPPLIYGEDIKDYEALEHHILSTISPTDAMEQIWTRDIVDAQWEIMRYKKIKTSILNASRHNSLISLKKEFPGKIAKIVEFDARSFDKIKKELSLPQGSLFSTGFVIYLETITTLENNIFKLECRRNDAYRQLEAYRNIKSKKRSDVIDIQAQQAGDKK